MEKRVRLLDYEDKEHFFTIEDFENVVELDFEILSGDGTLTVIYKDNKEVYFDSRTDRHIDFYDGLWCLQPKHLEVINRMSTHYDTDELDVAEGYE